MASTTDPRGSGFNAAEFRDAIRFAMNMGLPESTSERATFKWTVTRDFNVEDPGGNPYSWNSEPTEVHSRADKQVSVAVEFVSQASLASGNQVAQFDTARVILTLLDLDYAEIEGADIVELGGNTYKIDFVAPPIGLFGVTVYQIYASAEDES